MSPKCAVYRHLNAAGETLYIGCSANPIQRLAGHASKSPWARQVVRVDIEWFSSQEEALRVEERLIREECPPHNRAMTPHRSKWAESLGPKLLAEWMRKNEVTERELGRALGLQVSQVKALLKPTASPRNAKRRCISIVTSGEVQSGAWYRHYSNFGHSLDDPEEDRKWLEKQGVQAPHPMFPTPTRSAAA